MAPEAAWKAMVGSIRNLGRPGIASMAIAGVDVALWDLKARRLGVSVVDLLGAARDATRRMIDWLGREHGLPPQTAYMLCSVAVDLRISEIVDMPNFIVSAHCPLAIFDQGGD
jgi:acetamidase/formamidase